jgi:hypothetical protein
MVAAAAAQPTAAAGPSLKCDVIRNITPSWGIIVMGTGSVALSIAGVPWHFKGAAPATAKAATAPERSSLLITCGLLQPRTS